MRVIGTHAGSLYAVGEAAYDGRVDRPLILLGEDHATIEAVFTFVALEMQDGLGRSIGAEVFWDCGKGSNPWMIPGFERYEVVELLG